MELPHPVLTRTQFAGTFLRSCSQRIQSTHTRLLPAHNFATSRHSFISIETVQFSTENLELPQPGSYPHRNIPAVLHCLVSPQRTYSSPRGELCSSDLCILLYNKVCTLYYILMQSWRVLCSPTVCTKKPLSLDFAFALQ